MNGEIEEGWVYERREGGVRGCVGMGLGRGMSVREKGVSAALMS